jgi:hypothetical protein
MAGDANMCRVFHYFNAGGSGGSGGSGWGAGGDAAVGRGEGLEDYSVVVTSADQKGNLTDMHAAAARGGKQRHLLREKRRGANCWISCLLAGIFVVS